MICSLSLCAVASSLAAERIAREWDFSKAADTLGWTQAEPIKEFKVADGALIAVPGPGRPKLESPLFELEASPWQYVEIELKTDADGSGLMYYSNTTDDPYHGFRGELYTTFGVTGDGKWHTYTIRPFWQKQGKIIHIRLDPPGEKVAVRAVRIIDVKAGDISGQTSWQFKNDAAGWQAVGPAGKTENTARGLKITGDQSTCILSPPLNADSEDHLWATLRIASDTAHVATFRWASDDADGLQSAPVVLKGDGLVHTYALDLGDVSAWSGRILALGMTPSDAQETRSILLESVALGDKPMGPPEIEIVRFGLDYPIMRVGQKAKIVVEALNIGGSDAQSVAGAVTLVDRETHDTTTLLPKRIARLAPSDTARFEWDIDAKDERERIAVCRVNALGLDAGERSINLRFYPRLDATSVAGLKYVPEPARADTGDYLVGCYNFPGWHTYERWAVLDRFPERKPVLGYYREGDPEIADWHIDWALSHGISFFIYDWYWSQGGRQLEHGLHDAFLKSRYQDKMKFCLLWANHNPAKTSSEEDCLNVTRYWIENYFRRPNYLKIGGKNVMVIFSTHRLTEDMGSEAVKTAFDKMRKLCEDSGVGGLYLVACTYPGKERIESLLREGYDALSGYNYPAAGNKNRKFAPYEWMVEGYKDYWNQIADASSSVTLSPERVEGSKGPIPYIPVCEPGWDSRPWHGYNSYVRTGKSPALWEQMLENAKVFVDEPKHKQDGDKKLVFLEAWNEFGEGDYIEPHAEFGFDYLEAVRQVFAPASKKPEIIVPPDIGLGPYDLKKPEPRTAWDFSNPAQQDWAVGNMTSLSFAGGVMRAQAQNGDPAFYSPFMSVNADQLKTIEIRMRMDKGGEAQLFFTRPRGKMTEEKSVRFPVTGDNEFHVYTLDMSQNKRWQGKIGQVRLDPNAEAGSKVEVAYVRFR